MKKWMSAALYGFLLCWSAAQGNAAEVLPLVTAEAAQSWKQLGGVLTSDGHWLVYQIQPTPGLSIEPGSAHDVVTVVARRVAGDEERRYPAGAFSRGGGRIQVAASGRWFAFMRAPTDGEAGTVLVNLESEGTEDIPGEVFSFATADADASSADWLVVQSGGGQGSGTLLLRPLGRGEAQRVDGVHGFQLDGHGGRLAVASTRGLELYELNTMPARSTLLAAGDGGVFSALSWSADGRGLAALYTRGNQVQVYAIADVTRPGPAVRQVAVSDEGGTPQGPLQWRDARDGVYYQASYPPRAPQARAVSDASQVKPEFWRGGDARLPAEQARLEASPTLAWHYLDLGRKASRRLSDDSLTLVAPQGRGEYVLAYDLTPYGWMNIRGNANLQSRDYYLISLRSGERRLLARTVRVPFGTLMAAPQLSPDGELFLYPQDGHYWVQELNSGHTRNLTAGLPVLFTLPGNDPVAGWMPDDAGHLPGIAFQGWSSDGEFVLLSNKWDVWALPVRDAGRAVINLTGNGEREERVYVRVNQLTSGLDDAAVDLRAPVYFRVSDLKTGERGLARWTPAAGSQVLHMEYAAVGYIKAAEADVWVASRMTANEPIDYYRVDERFSLRERLTDGNPQHRRYARSPETRFLRYTTARGEVRRGLLQLPVGYEAGRRYPTVVPIYKEANAAVHQYSPPGVSHSNHWLERGYAVLSPDIVISRMNDAGQIALENVMAGVDAAIATGVVDPDRLGLYGHSYGAFQTMYILTQTDRFKVAAADGGLSNLWSLCLGVHGSSGLPIMMFCETNQPYFSGPWWARWDAYLQNSPLYHFRNIKTPLLLAHGTQDTQAPFVQSMELFNSMRRHGGTPVALLAYPDEGHTFGRAVAADYERRRGALFDHYLKGAAVPDWWDVREQGD